MASIMGCSVQGCGWQYGFHFGYGLDTIEEDVINEKCCVQVLRILTAKADAEILELEDDLAIIQSQFRWAELGKQDELEAWCATFRDMIDSLGSSIQNLKNEKLLREVGINADLVLHREPAGRIYDVIASLLKRDFPKDHEQVGELPEVEVVISECSESAASFEIKDPSHTTIAPDSISSSSGEQKNVPTVKIKLESTSKDKSTTAAASCVTTYSNEEKSEVRMDERVKLNGNKAMSEGGSNSCLSSTDSVEDNHDHAEDVKGLAGRNNYGSVSSQRAKKSKAIEPSAIAAVCPRDTFSCFSNTYNAPEEVLKKDGPGSPNISKGERGGDYEKQFESFFVLNPCKVKSKRKLQPKQQPRGISKDTLNPSPSEAKRRRLRELTKDSLSTKGLLDDGCNLGPIPKFAKGMRSKVVHLADRKTPAIGSTSVDHQEDTSNLTTGKELMIMKPSNEDAKDNVSAQLSAKERSGCRSRSPRLEDMSMAQLKDLAKKRNLRRYSKLKKITLIEELSKKAGWI